MPQTSIERLVLDIPGLSESQAQTIALAIASELATGLPGGPENVATMRVDLKANSGLAPEWLATEVVSEIRRQLLRTS
jgi:hypothetical protein